MTDAIAEGERPIAEILTIVETELLQLAHLLEHLQSTVSPLRGSATSTHALQQDLQSLDLATQHIHALATVINRLASVTHPNWTAKPNHLVATVTLQELANRLANKPTISNNHAAGECEIL